MDVMSDFGGYINSQLKTEIAKEKYNHSSTRLELTRIKERIVSKYKPLRLSDTMPFGKYKGEQIEDLIYDEPNYIAWLYNEEVVEFDIYVIQELEEKKII